MMKYNKCIQSGTWTEPKRTGSGTGTFKILRTGIFKSNRFF